jgi:hypothetical protein
MDLGETVAAPAAEAVEVAPAVEVVEVPEARLCGMLAASVVVSPADPA